jgi:hypothetical protein
MNRWIHKLNLSFCIDGSKERGKEKAWNEASNQPNNQSPWAQQGRAGRGQRMWGRRNGEEQRGQRGRRSPPALYYQSPQLRRHPPPCIDCDLGPAHMCLGQWLGGACRLPAQLLRWTSNFKLPPPDFPSLSSARFPASPEIDDSDKEGGKKTGKRRGLAVSLIITACVAHDAGATSANFFFQKMCSFLYSGKKGSYNNISQNSDISPFLTCGALSCHLMWTASSLLVRACTTLLNKGVLMGFSS